MTKKRIKIMHPAGLNARPAALFVQVASNFISRIWIETGSKKVNAKSIMGVMSLKVPADGQITILAQGNDADDAIDSLVMLIDSNFSHIPNSK